jgi:FkbH-like protein
MYEAEVNSKRESSKQIPDEVISRLGEAKRTIVDRTVLPWSEHCTECVWPTCYSSCDLYSAREDGKCRRFVDGMVRVDCSEALNSYVLKITFKRWGKLWAPGNIRLHPIEKSLRIERRDYYIGSVLVQLPAPSPIRNFLANNRYKIKKRLAHRAERPELNPTCFLLECYNPGTTAVRISLSIRSSDDKIKIPFQELLKLDTGFHRVRIPFDEINKVVNLAVPFNVELIPNDETQGTTLFFGLMDFVREVSEPETFREPKSSGSNPKVKCVVWDLDNTLWDGVLIEDGPEKLTLKRGIREIIEELDRRGILQSVATKNNDDEALSMLKRFGVDEYFLVPQISWMPKSGSIEQIARRLNIGINSLLFVDDSEFERRQVSAVLPDVRTLDANRYMEILDLDECKVPVTAESRERRKMYRVEEQRQELAASFADDYVAFLKHCDIRLNIRPMSEENLERVHELTQRTNQMNFSGNRYDRSVLKDILVTPYLDTYVLEVEDRFGSYGVVGFCIVDSRLPLMTDLMFSCRIQSKRVEHAFLGYLIREYIANTGKDFQANYRKNPRNAPSGKVFAEIGMRELANVDGVSRLVFPKEQAAPEDGLASITANERSAIL